MDAKALPDYAQRTFLIVDDDQFMASTVQKMLRQCHAHHIYRAASARDAMWLVKDEKLKIDCIISDWDMPGINGLQLLQAVRSGINPLLPSNQAFVMLTGHGEVDVVKAALLLDVNGYLIKPVSLRKLTTAIDQALAHAVTVKKKSYYKNLSLPTN